MARNRSSQRGVVKVAMSAVLAAFGVLLSASGCASGDSASGDSASGAEQLGSESEAITCSGKGIGCPPDNPCGDWTCPALLGGTCTVKPQDPALATGDKCPIATRQVGVCVAAQCCGGCYLKATAKGILDCSHPGDELTFCGALGDVCTDCSGTDPCTTYSCQGGGCKADPIADGKPCVGINGLCLQGACCTGCVDKNGVCQPGTDVSACGQSNSANGFADCKNCDDNNSCSVDSCQNGVCAAPTPSNGTCPDGNLCNGDEVCNGVQCNAGTPLNCDDKNPCTTDSCDALKGCVNTPVEAGTSCDVDNDACNGVDACVGTVCTKGTPVDCDDNNICTTDSCTKATGKCVNAPNTLDCSDKNLCTVTDKCSNGVCVGTGAPNCDDHQDCTADSCDPTLGCQNKAVADDTACDDGNVCSTGDKCTGGKCLSTGGKVCDDNNPCTQNACNPAASTCNFPNEANGTPCIFDKCHQNSVCQTGACAQGDPIKCDDSNPCTTDSCDPATGCTHVNADGGDCSDNDACTHGDKCQGGKCVGVTLVCSPLDECHVAGTCNAKGSCDDPRADDGTDCKNKLGSGTCQTGICQIVEAAGGAGGAGGDGGAGAGGQPATGGTNTGGTTVAQAGEPPTMNNGGAGNEPATGGESTTPGAGTSGKSAGGKSAGGTASVDGGAPDVPAHVFVRDPGGCSCSVPSRPGSSGWLWLGALALAAGAGSRRRSKNRMLM